MGFSLKRFIEELEEIINNRNIDFSKRIEQLRDNIESNKKYAKDCGQLT